ncbi:MULTISPECIES: H-type small acid-soluble spore protein [Bacillales]|jgi:small acid-soluble spore protein H (minor)|uniref:Spore protein n=1 Tax=Brevibacillus aydinogluensis TaxID=927786 RepID=A0AA48M7R2_9BACL|nr:MULTISPECIES: H-type small acid-soluble spore protein [Bacillales]REK64884.1 MAG: H-type small acid-soluble spore protein [Brevibacillus sp.]MBR8661545.1 H-type small acid-soluble spore protein [Brevibacillus sp. NL20B1]MDT3417749.1 small acid-soluble spore protein H (minor) [Brevibacillus aydinogluensis]NNV03393.1 H-type small acid-soluble spore protein [Brevibacillus sp. MCWH]UFJ61884.1 H-type small acid-soluble spore protein [Anoxybacillus sediminis]
MDVKRAQEILRSSEKIEVQYKGQPVWIDGVDERTATARVHIEGNPANSMAVEVGQLEEK